MKRWCKQLKEDFVAGTNKGVCLTEECVRTGKFRWQINFCGSQRSR